MGLLIEELRVGLPLPRQPVMAEIAGRHPRLNLRNLEAVAAARVLAAAY